MARERLEMLANGKDSTRNDMQALDVMESAYTSPIFARGGVERRVEISQIENTAQICILGVDGLENEAFE